MRLNSPKHAIGRLAREFSNLIAGPKARVDAAFVDQLEL